jgi:hypothetical protein
MDMDSTNAAIEISEFPKELADKIWVKERTPFEMY